MKLVYQETECGCGIACAAMILGVSFGEARRLFEDGGVDRGRSGSDVARALKRAGVDCAPRLRRVRSFAAIPPGSVLAVRFRSAPDDSHFIVKDGDGLLLDPVEGRLRRLPRDYEVTSYLPILDWSDANTGADALYSRPTDAGARTGPHRGRPRRLPPTEVTLVCRDCGVMLDTLDANAPSLMRQIPKIRHAHALSEHGGIQ